LSCPSLWCSTPEQIPLGTVSFSLLLTVVHFIQISVFAFELWLWG
jgi:hypothetical protein